MGIKYAKLMHGSDWSRMSSGRAHVHHMVRLAETVAPRALFATEVGIKAGDTCGISQIRRLN